MMRAGPVPPWEHTAPLVGAVLHDDETFSLGTGLPPVEGTGRLHVRFVEGTPGTPTGQSSRVVSLTTNVYVDPKRLLDNAGDDARYRAFGCWFRIDGVLNDLGRSGPWVSSRRVRDPQIFNVPETDGVIMLSATYEQVWA